MFSLFIVLLNFSKSLPRDQTKCLFLNDEPCMVRPTLVDMNPFTISLNECTGSCKVVSHQKCVFQKKQKT